MRVSIDKTISTPVYVQIKNNIRDLIQSGSLPKGFVLPPERKLATTIGVSRSTVIKAYDELKALGLVGSHIGKGTVVIAEIETKTINEEINVLPLSWYPFFDKNIESANDTTSGLMNEGNSKDVISFAAGVADPRLYPIKQLHEIQENHGSAFQSETLNLCAVKGYYPLRESISHLMEFRSITASPKEVMILSGSMQGIDFAARTFISPGDIVIVEEPTFLHAIQLFKFSGAKIIGVPLDGEGMRVDVLEAHLQRYKPKFIYTIPTFQNPTGTMMSMQRRVALLHLAYKYQVPILEDDPYGELIFSGSSFPPLKALDQHDYVIYFSSFSKTLFSGMRVGWVVAPTAVIKKFALLKQMTDLHVNIPSQYMLDHFLRDGYYEAHLRMVEKEYLKKRDTMVQSLRRKPGLMEFEVPNGGYYLWCKLPQGISKTKLWSTVSAKGVTYTPGNVFYPQESDGDTYIRLNFSYETCDRIEKGISIIIDVVEELNKQGVTIGLNRNIKPIV